MKKPDIPQDEQTGIKTLRSLWMAWFTETQQQASRNKDTTEEERHERTAWISDLAERLDKLTQMRDPLVVLKKKDS